MSEELKSPLASILAMMSCLIQLVQNKSATNMIDLSIVQINIILCLVDDTLDVKMISLDKFCPQIKEFKPLVMIQEVLQLFERSAKITKTSLVFYEVSFESMMDFKEHTYLLAEE